MADKSYYEIESRRIIERMLSVLIKAERKADSKKYRDTLEKLELLENE